MKISDLTNKFKLQKTPLHSASDTIRRKLVFSTEIVLWVILLIVAVIEVYVAYAGIFKNLVFKDIDPSSIESPSRINFQNYDSVIDRLEEVEEFEPSASIDFSGVNPETGRNNPFSDPE